MQTVVLSVFLAFVAWAGTALPQPIRGCWVGCCIAFGIANLLGGMAGFCILFLFIVPVTAIITIIYYLKNPPG